MKTLIRPLTKYSIFVALDYTHRLPVFVVRNPLECPKRRLIYIEADFLFVGFMGRAC